MNNKQTKQTVQRFSKKIAVAAGLILSFATTAQDTIQPQQLKELVVSGSRTEQSLLDAGRSISVIDQEAIKNSVYTNVAELLSKQEGIYIVGTGQNPGALQTMYLRGANADHTIILIDGVRITDPSSVDNALNLAELSLTNIERIEIVRGSHSTLYGTSAIGGVINIITKKGAKAGFHGNAALTGGTFGKATSDLAQDVQLGYTFKNGVYATATLLNNNVKGLDATVDTVTTSGVYKNRDQDNFDKTDVVLKAGYRKNKWDAFVSYKNTQQKMDIDKGAYQDDDNYTVDFQRKLLSYQLAYAATAKWDIRFAGGYTDMQRTAIDDSSQVDAAGNTDHAYFSSVYSGTVLNNEVQAAYKGEKLGLVIGAGNYRETMNNKSYYTNTAWAYTSESDLDTLDLNNTTSSVFVHADLSGKILGPKAAKFKLATGLRLGKHNVFGTFTTYEVNPSYKLSENSLIYGSYSTGFNAPSLYRLYAPGNNYISNVSRGNAQLTPEKSQSLEIGFKQQVNKSTSLTLSIFRTQVDDLIEYVYLWDKNIGLDTLGNDWMRDDYRGDTYLNLGRQVNHGFEIGFRTNLTEKVSLAGNVSIVSGMLHYAANNSEYLNNYHVQLYNSGTFLTKETELQGLARRSNTANLSLTYAPIKKLQMTADVRYAGIRSDVYYNAALGPYGALGQKAVGDYALFGFNLRYEPIKNLNLNLQISNLLNADYQEIYGYTTRGRAFYLKVAYQF